MKTKTISLTALALLPAALFTLTSCSSTSTPPPPVGLGVLIYKKGVLGGVFVQTVKMTATETAIDHAKRTATLLVPDGKKFAVKVGREAVNFDQVRVGDQVTAVVAQRMVISVDKGGATSSPDGLAAETTQVTAKVVALDSEKHEATLEFDDGNIQTFVRKDVDLSRHKLGERVVFRITQMDAIWVEEPE